MDVVALDRPVRDAEAFLLAAFDEAVEEPVVGLLALHRRQAWQQAHGHVQRMPIAELRTTIVVHRAFVDLLAACTFASTTPTRDVEKLELLAFALAGHLIQQKLTPPTRQARFAPGCKPDTVVTLWTGDPVSMGSSRPGTLVTLRCVRAIRVVELLAASRRRFARRFDKTSSRCCWLAHEQQDDAAGQRRHDPLQAR